MLQVLQVPIFYFLKAVPWWEGHTLPGTNISLPLSLHDMVWKGLITARAYLLPLSAQPAISPVPSPLVPLCPNTALHHNTRPRPSGLCSPPRGAPGCPALHHNTRPRPSGLCSPPRGAPGCPALHHNARPRPSSLCSPPLGAPGCPALHHGTKPRSSGFGVGGECNKETRQRSPADLLQHDRQATDRPGLGGL